MVGTSFSAIQFKVDYAGLFAAGTCQNNGENTKHLVLEFDTTLVNQGAYILYAYSDLTVDSGTNDMVVHPFKNEAFGCGYYYFDRVGAVQDWR